MKPLQYTTLLITLALLTACSMTKGLPENDQLFTGLKKTVWTDAPKESPYQDHLESTMEEVEIRWERLEVCQVDDQEFW